MVFTMGADISDHPIIHFQVHVDRLLFWQSGHSILALQRRDSLSLTMELGVIML